MKDLCAMPLVVMGKKYEVVLLIGEYSHKSQIAIIACDKNTGEEVTDITKCLADADVPAGHIAVKDYSENEGVLKQLITHGVCSKPVYMQPTGYVEFAICKLLKQPVCPPPTKSKAKHSLR